MSKFYQSSPRFKQSNCFHVTWNLGAVRALKRPASAVWFGFAPFEYAQGKQELYSPPRIPFSGTTGSRHALLSKEVLELQDAAREEAICLEQGEHCSCGFASYPPASGPLRIVGLSLPNFCLDMRR